MGSSFKTFNNNLSNNNDNNNNSNDIKLISKNINKYKDTLVFTWNKLLENKQEIGLSIYKSIIFGSTSRANGRAKDTSLIFANTNLNLQSGRFMDMLDNVISKLENPQTLIETLHILSNKHNSYSVRKQNYIDFKNGFMKTIKIKFHTMWNDKYNNAWIWFWNFIISTMSKDEHQIINTNINSNNISKQQHIIDINNHFINLYNLLCDTMRSNGYDMPQEIIEIVTVFSLNLTSFCETEINNSNQLIISDCEITGNNNCIATRIKNTNTNINNNIYCGTIISKYWISNHINKIDYIHKIEVILEHQNINNKIDSFHGCIGFISDDIINNKIININGKNAFGDLQNGFAVRCWDKRLIHNGA
eukprot:161251_1